MVSRYLCLMLREIRNICLFSLDFLTSPPDFHEEIIATRTIRRYIVTTSTLNNRKCVRAPYDWYDPEPQSGSIPCSISSSVPRPGSMPPETTRASERGSSASPSRDAMDENGAIGWRVIAGISRNTCSSKNPSDMSISP